MENTGSVSDILGKKIFFLCPTAVVQNKIISELVQQEYEVYVAKSKETLKRVLKKYPDAIVFVDIDEQMPEKEWESWITGLMNAPETKGVSVGIVTANDDENLKRKYLLTLNIPCGYTILKFDLDKSISHILEALHEADAKGRRKFIRTNTEKDTHVTLNLPIHGMYVNGQIKDISVVGVSCTIDGNPEIQKNTLFDNIQFKLHSSLLMTEGIILGSRIEGKEKFYVILFTQRIDPDVRIKIRKYIQQNLQIKMDDELK